MASLSGQNVFGELRNILTGIVRELETNIDSNRLDSIHRRIDQIVRQLHRLPALNSSLTDQANNVLRSLDTLEELQSNDNNGYNTRLSHSGGRGRPRFEIDKQQLEYFLDNGFTGPDIAAMLCVSLRTVRRRMHGFRLSIRGLHTNLSDAALDMEVGDICSLFPNIGYRRLLGELGRREIRICRTRARESLRRVDPFGVMLRWISGPVTRREYHVPGPLSLWHIDGHHKLIRSETDSFSFLIHAHARISARPLIKFVIYFLGRIREEGRGVGGAQFFILLQSLLLGSPGIEIKYEQMIMKNNSKYLIS